MQLPLYLKWNQARNRRSLLWLYMTLALVVGLAIWSLPGFVHLLVSGAVLLLDAENRHLVLAALVRAILAIGVMVAIGSGSVALWNFITTHIWRMPQRYAAAIDRLSHEQIESRLEGIRTLKRIAKLVVREHGTITTTLVSFVQERASIYPRDNQSSSTIGLQEPQTIAADVQAALAVIGRKPLICRLMWRLIRKAYWEGDRQINMQINMGLTNLSRARLHRANFREANLYRTDLQRADLHQINLQQANLQAANLRACNLHRANLQQANLQNINLQDATLHRANLQQVNLYNANLQGVNLYSANLQAASLQAANLQGASLCGVNLQGAFLYGANLQAASLQEANLQEAFLAEVKLQGANLYKANLRGATGLTEMQLSQAKLCKTVLPDGSVSDRNCSELGLCDPLHPTTLLH